MTTIELARRAAELNSVPAAQKAYVLALDENAGGDPAVELECCAYLLYTDGSKDIALSRLVPLFNRGAFRQEVMDLLLKFCYVPAAAAQEKTYEQNMAKLKKYPYFFAGDRQPVPYGDLPVRFFPFGKKGYVAYDQRACAFGEYQDLTHEAVTHSFNDGSDQPILASDLYSQYELDYLRDCVRRSEDVARDNHIYLRFTSWEDFCSYAQVIRFDQLLAKKKFVFLIGEQEARYPIDWLADYGKDYGALPVKPIRLDEVQRIIWHVQFSTHNGGDFFNEVLDNHPNLIYFSSSMWESLAEVIENGYQTIRRGGVAGLGETFFHLGKEAGPGDTRRLNLRIKRALAEKRSGVTRKDILVAMYLSAMEGKGGRDSRCDPSCRFAPALVFQPHFSNLYYYILRDPKETMAIMTCNGTERLRDDWIFREFKYIKTFLPVRRFTTSYGATVRFALNADLQKNVRRSFTTWAFNRVKNRSFFHDEGDPLYNDARMVRFEDGKLNPKATFTALARFLDIPYTDSMTYCSEFGVHDVSSMAGNVVGFDPAAVYRTYDDYTSPAVNRVLEYYLRDAMELLGYEPHFSGGEPVTEADLRMVTAEENRIWKERMDLLEAARPADAPPLRQISGVASLNEAEEGGTVPAKASKETLERIFQTDLEQLNTLDKVIRGEMVMVGQAGRDLVFTELLRPDPDLLDQPLYR